MRVAVAARKGTNSVPVGTKTSAWKGCVVVEERKNIIVIAVIAIVVVECLSG